MTTSTTPPTPLASPDASHLECERLFRAERTLLKVRWVGVVFAFLQVVFYYIPHPGHQFRIALAICALLVIGNAMMTVLLWRQPEPLELRKLSFVSLALDLVVAMGFVWTYTFDPNTAIWAVIYILPLGGAIRFQRKGAIGVTLAAIALYVTREIWGSIHYGYEFFVVSVTFRMGIALLIAYVAGTATRELVQGRREVEHANHELSELNQTIREFVTIASHDMRTPVSVISGLSNALVRDGNTMSEHQKSELIQVINRRSQSLDRLVNDLLATSSIDAGIIPHRAEQCDLTDLLKDLVENSDIPSVELSVRENVFAFADPEHIRRIVGNLLTNAHRYGGEPIVVSYEPIGNLVDITVKDHGPGVNESFVPRLYEKFARAPETARTIEGTGLGLSIVKGLAVQNGGDSFYRRNETGGAEFHVTLPLAESPSNGAAS